MASSRAPTVRSGCAQFLVALAVDPHRPDVGLVEPEDHAHGRGLARAVRAEEPGDLPGVTLKDRSSTASFLPYRLVRLCASIIRSSLMPVSTSACRIRFAVTSVISLNKP